MFGAGLGPQSQQSELLRLLALSNLAPGGGSNPPLPAFPAAGGQTAPMPSDQMGRMPPPSVGMFGAKAPTSQSEAAVISQAPRYGQGSQGQPGYAMSFAGGDAPDVMAQGPLGVDQFGLGRDLARLSEVAPVKAKGHKGLFPGKDLPIILGILGDALAGAAGRPPTFGPMMMRRREAEDDHNRQLELWRAKVEAGRAERMRPQIEQVGNSIGWLDPTAQTFKPFYSAPQPFEAYAAARGFAPGTPEYQAAVQDYRLGSWSDPAMEAKAELEGIRYGNRDALQDERLATTRRGQDMRSADQRRGQNVRSADTRRGQDMTDKRGRDSAAFRGKPGKGGAAPDSGADLIGPVYRRGNVRMQFSKSQNKYVRVP